MSETPMRVAVIIGSTREGRYAPTVANWFVKEAQGHGGFAVDVIDLAEADLPVVMSRNLSPEAVKSLGAVTSVLDAADAFVVITPEYNHSYPASLKNAIDWHSRQWQAKPVGFVSYGGLAGGLRAVEHLRPVFAELHAVTVRDTVSFHGFDNFDEDGEPKSPEGCHGAAKTMLDQLVWWAQALRTARREHPYGK
jgi:NAD(P)H-dependent FMN reductase